MVAFRDLVGLNLDYEVAFPVPEERHVKLMNVPTNHRIILIPLINDCILPSLERVAQARLLSFFDANTIVWH